MKFPNEVQTPKERRQKYWLARSHGHTPSHACRMRDFSMPNLEKRLGYGTQEVQH